MNDELMGEEKELLRELETVAKASVTSEQQAAALAIGEDSQLSVAERIHELFLALEDPLLSAVDVHVLLGGTSSKKDVAGGLVRLKEDGLLESDDNTERPFDKQGTELFRLVDVETKRLKLLGIETPTQNPEKTRLQFTCEGRLIRSIARVDRLDALADTGAQRELIKSHAKAIGNGILQGTEIPNSILLVFDSEFTGITRFGEEDFPESFVVVRDLQPELLEYVHPNDPVRVVQSVRVVEIDIPFRKAAFDREKRCYLVDGQQRTAGLSVVSVEHVPTYTLAVNAFIADDDEQRTIFRIANNTAKIKTDFQRAIRAVSSGEPKTEEDRRVRAQKVLALEDPSSPFLGICQYPGILKTPEQVVAPGSLFQVVGIIDDTKAFPKYLSLVDAVAKTYSIIKDTWPNAWGKRPGESKLMHGAGLRSMARLAAFHIQGAYAQGEDFDGDEFWSGLRRSIERLAPIVQWTASDAAVSTATAQRNWERQIRDRQVTSSDIDKLSNWLLQQSAQADREAASTS